MLILAFSPVGCFEQRLSLLAEQPMVWGSRKSERITFQRGIDARMIGIDGTWSRACRVVDMSQTGARLIVEEAISGLVVKEFFLVFSTSGRVWRRCELVRINGDELGVRFLKTVDAPGQAKLRRPGKAPPDSG